jgi:DNA-binding XRE family transcriptional regulator
MESATITLAGRRYAVVPLEDYRRLLKGTPPVDERELPPMPAPLANGNYPAIEAGRVLLARDIIIRRKAARLSQAELARRAGVRGETLNRIEKPKVTADVATVDKIVAVLEAAEKR